MDSNKYQQTMKADLMQLIKKWNWKENGFYGRTMVHSKPQSQPWTTSEETEAKAFETIVFYQPINISELEMICNEEWVEIPKSCK